MVDLEQKLRNYYEHNLDYRQSPEALQRLLALESSPQAAKKPRRRYALPIAAAIALALSLGAVLAWLHAPKQAEPPGPGYTLTAPSETEPEPPKAPEPKAPAIPEPQAPEKNDPPESPATPELTADPPQSAPAQRTVTPAPVQQDDPAPAEPEEEMPEPPDDPIPPEPDDPEPPPADDPPPVDDPPPADGPEPADELPPDDPPQPDDPPIPPQEESNINAVYRMKGGRELLTLTCLSNGASVELDVTGWMEEASLPDPPDDTPPAPAENTLIYSGHSSIVDVIFDSSITYHLIRGEDGTVRVDLDVA